MKILAAGLLVLSSLPQVQAGEKLKALIIDGQNNHSWKTTTPVLKWILEESGRFTVDVSTTPPSPPHAPAAPKADASPEAKDAHAAALAKWKEQNAAADQSNAELWKKWSPDFKSYDVIVSNYNGQDWPEAVRTGFVEYIRTGGGLVIYHAADNSFPGWPEFNEMIAVGGWNGRNEKSGPMVRYRDGKVVFDTSPGAGGAHGKQSEFLVEIRDTEHPVTKGLPSSWLHATDELYSKLRGPAQNLTVLATAHSDLTNENEPILMAVTFGKGRIFHTVLGHAPGSMVDIGFQATLLRGAEWAATGHVTFPAPKPEEMPPDKIVKRDPPATPAN
ncbi:MAG: ThuA domain-containing protein [Verrucomicrobiae bacterium]